jgi:hypothetical protein
MVPGIHVLATWEEDVDGRDKPGLDACRNPAHLVFAKRL